MTGADEFERQARDLGLSDVVRAGNRVTFTLDIPDGSFAGETRRIGAEVPEDFPITAPPGPHINPATVHTGGAVHASSFGTDWAYWSRPAQNWVSNRSVQAWIRHVRSLFAQV